MVFVLVSYLGTVHIVHREDCAPLIQILDKTEPARLARVLVAHEVDAYNLAALREHTQDVALGQVEGQATDENMCRVLILCVPRSRFRMRGRQPSLASV